MEIFLVIWFGCGLLGAMIMSGKGRSGAGGFLLGICLGIIGLLIAVFMSSKEEPVRAAASKPRRDYGVQTRRLRRSEEIEDWGRGYDDFYQAVSGESWCQPEIRAAATAAGHTLRRDEDGDAIFDVVLIREPDNQYDRNAIKVCDADRRRHVGYIPKGDAEGLAPVLDRFSRQNVIVGCRAQVRGKRDNYGIVLDLDTRGLYLGARQV